MCIQKTPRANTVNNRLKFARLRKSLCLLLAVTMGLIPVLSADSSESDFFLNFLRQFRFDPADYSPLSTAVDANGFAYLGTRATPAQIVKVDLKTRTRVGSLTLEPQNVSQHIGFITVALLDNKSEYGYFVATDGSPGGWIVKVRLSDLVEMTRVRPDPDAILTGFKDPKNDIAYLGHISGRIHKFDLATLSVIGTLHPKPGHAAITASVQDRDGRFAYFCFRDGQALVKVDLSNFTNMGSLDLGIGVEMNAAVIDSDNEFAYFGGPTGTIIKVNLKKFKIDQTVPADRPLENLRSVDNGHKLGVYDFAKRPKRRVPSQIASTVLMNSVLPVNQSNPSRLSGNHRVGQSEPTQTMSITNWASGIDFDTDVLMDGYGEFGYFTGFGTRLLKVRMDDMTLEDILIIPSNPGDRFNLSFIQPDGEYLYGWLHNYPNPTLMIKIRLLPQLEIEEMFAIPSGAIAELGTMEKETVLAFGPTEPRMAAAQER